MLLLIKTYQIKKTDVFYTPNIITLCFMITYKNPFLIFLSPLIFLILFLAMEKYDKQFKDLIDLEKDVIDLEKDVILSFLIKKYNKNLKDFLNPKQYFINSIFSSIKNNMLPSNIRSTISVETSGIIQEFMFIHNLKYFSLFQEERLHNLNQQPLIQNEINNQSQNEINLNPKVQIQNDNNLNEPLIQNEFQEQLNKKKEDFAEFENYLRTIIITDAFIKAGSYASLQIIDALQSEKLNNMKNILLNNFFGYLVNQYTLTQSPINFFRIYGSSSYLSFLKNIIWDYQDKMINKLELPHCAFIGRKESSLFMVFGIISNCPMLRVNNIDAHNQGLIAQYTSKIQKLNLYHRLSNNKKRILKDKSFIASFVLSVLNLMEGSLGIEESPFIMHLMSLENLSFDPKDLNQYVNVMNLIDVLQNNQKFDFVLATSNNFSEKIDSRLLGLFKHTIIANNMSFDDFFILFRHVFFDYISLNNCGDLTFVHQYELNDVLKRIASKTYKTLNNSNLNVKINYLNSVFDFIIKRKFSLEEVLNVL